MHPKVQIAVHRYLPKTVHCCLPTTGIKITLLSEEYIFLGSEEGVIKDNHEVLLEGLYKAGIGGNVICCHFLLIFQF